MKVSGKRKRPYHLHFEQEDYDMGLLDATKLLVYGKHSKLTNEIWLAEASWAYSTPLPNFRYIARPNSNQRLIGGWYSTNNVTVYGWSPTTLAHEFRHHAQHHHKLLKGSRSISQLSEEDAKGWSLSLVFLAAPDWFSREVQSGKIMHMKPEHLGLTA